jgi:hypothetical protein
MIMIVGCPRVASKELRGVGPEREEQWRANDAKAVPTKSLDLLGSPTQLVSCARQVNAVLQARCANGRTIPRNDSMIERRVSRHHEPTAAKVFSRVKKAFLEALLLCH